MPDKIYNFSTKENITILKIFLFLLVIRSKVLTRRKRTSDWRSCWSVWNTAISKKKENLGTSLAFSVVAAMAPPSYSEVCEGSGSHVTCVQPGGVPLEAPPAYTEVVRGAS